MTSNSSDNHVTNSQEKIALRPSEADVKTVGIIGAGPAGLATAIALQNLGLEVQIYDRAKAFRPIGAGLTLSPNGVRSLDAISPGLARELKQKGSQIKRFKVRTSGGWPIITQRITGDEYDHPFMAIRWFCLQTLLKSKLPSGSLHLNHRLTSFEETEQGVTLNFENNHSTTVDLLIGADGIHSAVRQQLFDIETPAYGGWMTWRGMLKYQHKLLPPHQASVFAKRAKIFLLLDNGDGNLSWSLEMAADTRHQSPTARDVKERVIEETAKWHPAVREAVNLTDANIIVERPVCKPLLLSEWSSDRVTLIGDAAHAMGPALGQGTNTTFEDVWVLSNCLSQASSLKQALQDYENIRIKRTNIVQFRTLFSAAQMGNPFLSPKRFKTPIGPVPERAQLNQKDFSDWLYGYRLPA